MISGKCTKPDEADIKQVIKYAHEKLNSRHVAPSAKSFEKLNYNLLIAGELELAVQKDITQAERFARINIAKTLCYHRAYLNEKELIDGYEQTMKNIEQGNAKWEDNLEQQLHEYLNYKANLLLREKLQSNKGEQTKPSQKWETRPQTTKNDKTSNDTDKTIFCAAYNKGNCLFTDHHEGRFSNKAVTKWHICSKCYKQGERKSHREIDDDCPNKA